MGFKLQISEIYPGVYPWHMSTTAQSSGGVVNLNLVVKKRFVVLVLLESTTQASLGR